MAASTGSTDEQKYVISRIDYDDEIGCFPTKYIRVNGRSFDCAVHFEGTLENAIQLAKSKLSYDVEELAVFCWDHENAHWSMDATVSDYQD